jgi:photosystem II stability/assembly factor-like uncharacterized protein
MVACLSPNGCNLNAGDGPPTRLLVSTLRGITVLERASPGTSWIERGRRLEGQHCSSLMREPRRGGLFAGMHSGGLFFSGDGGESWEPRSNGISVPHVYSLAYAHRGGDVVLYAGTEPAAMFRSDDYGASWIEQPGVRETKGRDKWSFPSKPHQAHVKSITVDPRDPQVLYAAVEQGDLLKTVDGGASWRVLEDYSKPTDWTYRDIHLVVVHPDSSDELYMTTGMGVYCSRDAGETWQLLVDNSFRIGYPDHLIVSPRDGNTMFMAGAKNDPGKWQTSHRAETTIVRTHDRVKTWTDNIEAMCIASWPGGFTLFAGNTDGEVFASDDGAESWSCIAAGLAPVTKGNHYRSLQAA